VSNEVCGQLEDVVSGANDEGGRRRDLRGFSDAASPAVPRSYARVIDLDVSWLVPADLAAVDALARLQVAAARRRSQLCLHGADGGLAELIDFCGLGDAVQFCSCCRPWTSPVHDPDTDG
jgi:ABC-type transporter Mla MlaB component